jgi:hypothetical protein
MTGSKFMARIICAGLLLGCAVVVASAQSPKDSFVIYAKAGRINHAIGNARVRRTADDPGKILAMSDELTSGDIVSTGADTRLEVLLSPGAYLRMADNSEFQMASTSLDDIRLILNRGSAVIETGGGPDETLRIQVAMPAGTAVIDKAGIYRLNVEGQRSELLVIEGSTVIQPAMIKVKEGKRAAITAGVAEPVAKFDKKAERDALDNWSRERAQYLAKANRSLDQRELTRALNVFNPYGFANSRTNGLWVFSARFGGCVFVPFDPFYWNSPYGYGYTNGNGWWPVVIAGNGHPTGNPTSGGTPRVPGIKPVDTDVRMDGIKPRGDSMPTMTPVPATRANAPTKGH